MPGGRSSLICRGAAHSLEHLQSLAHDDSERAAFAFDPRAIARIERSDDAPSADRIAIKEGGKPGLASRMAHDVPFALRYQEEPQAHALRHAVRVRLFVGIVPEGRYSWPPHFLESGTR